MSNVLARMEQFLVVLNERVNQMEEEDRAKSLAHAKAEGDDLGISMYSKPGFIYKIEPEVGKRYVRLVVSSSLNGEPMPERRAYGFIDLNNGDLLKSAGWKAPAKHVRGNIFADDFGLTGCDRYGMITFR